MSYSLALADRLVALYISFVSSNGLEVTCCSDEATCHWGASLSSALDFSPRPVDLCGKGLRSHNLPNLDHRYKGARQGAGIWCALNEYTTHAALGRPVIPREDPYRANPDTPPTLGGRRDLEFESCWRQPGTLDLTDISAPWYLERERGLVSPCLRADVISTSEGSHGTNTMRHHSLRVPLRSTSGSWCVSAALVLAADLSLRARVARQVLAPTPSDLFRLAGIWNPSKPAIATLLTEQFLAVLRDLLESSNVPSFDASFVAPLPSQGASALDLAPCGALLPGGSGLSVPEATLFVCKACGLSGSSASFALNAFDTPCKLTSPTVWLGSVMASLALRLSSLTKISRMANPKLPAGTSRFLVLPPISGNSGFFRALPTPTIRGPSSILRFLKDWLVSLLAVVSSMIALIPDMSLIRYSREATMFVGAVSIPLSGKLIIEVGLSP